MRRPHHDAHTHGTHDARHNNSTQQAARDAKDKLNMEMTEIPINANEATIKTATIEVRVMKIGNRQVTLSVFRQLKSESIIDLDTGELRGVPWGRVNYHVDCDGLGQPHMHVVWQKGNELRRSIAFLPWERSLNATRTIPNFLTPIFGDFSRYFELFRCGVIKEATKARLTYGKGVRCDAELRFLDQCYGRDEKVAISILQRIDDSMDIIDQWQQSYSQLEQLDQLFIAV